MHRYLHATSAYVGFVSETKCGTVKAKDHIVHLTLLHFKFIPSSGKSGGRFSFMV